MSKKTETDRCRCLPVKKDQNFAYNIYLEESFQNEPLVSENQDDSDSWTRNVEVVCDTP